MGIVSYDWADQAVSNCRKEIIVRSFLLSSCYVAIDLRQPSRLTVASHTWWEATALPNSRTLFTLSVSGLAGSRWACMQRGPGVTRAENLPMASHWFDERALWWLWWKWRHRTLSNKTMKLSSGSAYMPCERRLRLPRCSQHEIRTA